MDPREVHTLLMNAAEQALGVEAVSTASGDVDVHGAWVRRFLERHGVDHQAALEVIARITAGGSELVIQMYLQRNRNAVSDGMSSVAVSALMLGVALGSGAIPDDEDAAPVAAEDLYLQDERLPAGGYIDDAGGLVRVLGVDYEGRVAAKLDGKLFPVGTRHSVECFLRHHTRVDDVPILGGEAA